MQNDTTTEKQVEEKQMVFFPDFLFKEAVAALIVVIAVVALAVFLPIGMGDPADPSDSAFKPKPEWYFMSAYYLLKLFPSSIEIIPTVIGPSIGLLFLTFMPFIDKHPERSPRRRPRAMMITIFTVIAAIVLTILGIYIE
jgi:quinol-cytochrome oxidoreductase complex cytochrome b subunit